MKKIALIGDSIRMGYYPVVKAALSGQAAVWQPEINGGDSRNILNHLDNWLHAAQPDVVHINCGLHDIKKPFDTGVPAISLDEYGDNVTHILTQLGDRVAHVVWALTTPVNMEWHHQNKDFDRFEQDVLAYNHAALLAAGSLGVPVNDLYSVVMETGRDRLLVADGVHFSPEGYALLGACVAANIQSYLN